MNWLRDLIEDWLGLPELRGQLDECHGHIRALQDEINDAEGAITSLEARFDAAAP